MPDTKVSLGAAAAALDGTELLPCTQAGVDVSVTAAQVRAFAATAAPTAHKTSHQDGGADEISVAGLSGLLADGQTPLAHAAAHSSGGSDPITHNNLAGLTTGDPHTQYAALAGRSGGTTQYGGTAAGNNLTLSPNSSDNASAVQVARGADLALITTFKNDGVRFYRNVFGGSGGRPFLRYDAAPTATLPAFCPNDNDGSSGMGYAGTGQPTLIGSGVEALRVNPGAGGVSAGVFMLVPVEANSAVAASPNLLAVMESGAVLTNEGSTAENCHTLPSAAAGYKFTFICQDSDGIKISANTGDTIRSGATVSASAGYIRTATIGNVITLVSVNATEWFVMRIIGTWTIDS